MGKYREYMGRSLVKSPKLWRKSEGDYFSRNFVYILRTTTTRHMVSFIDFYFHFLANFQTYTSPHMFSIFTHMKPRTVGLGYLCSLILPFDQGILLCDSSIEKSCLYSQGSSKYGITNVFTLSCVLLSKRHCLWCEYSLRGQELPGGVLQERNHSRYHCTISIQCQ